MSSGGKSLSGSKVVTSCYDCCFNILPVDRRGQPDTVCSLALQKEIHGAADCYQNAYRYWGPRMNIASLRMWG